MLRILSVEQQAILYHYIRDALHRLTGLPKGSGNTRHGEASSGKGDGANDFPAGMG
jgi:hypothetical protein